MGNHQTSEKRKKTGKSAACNSTATPVIEVTEHNHFHAGGDGTGNPFEKYIYPFENLVFEGAGNRLLAYCGAVRVLEESGVWKQIKRLAGANTGAIVAALLGVGYNSHDIQQLLSNNLQQLFEGKPLGCCTCSSMLLRRIRGKYGCETGQKLSKWIGKRLEKATGTANITFQQVYERFGKEICIQVTNVNQQLTEYCHVKTTPSMPVRIAVCMSLATPGKAFFNPSNTKSIPAEIAMWMVDCFVIIPLTASMAYSPGNLTIPHGESLPLFVRLKHSGFVRTRLYLDGKRHQSGQLKNNGWWLSLDKQDSFLRNSQPLSDLPRLLDKSSRFANYNEKTMGFVVFSETDPDALQAVLEEREGKILPASEPSTKLSRRIIPQIKSRNEAAAQHDQFVVAACRFLRAIEASGLSEVDEITEFDLQNVLKQKTEATPADVEEIFGTNATTAEDVFRILTKSRKKWTSYNRIVRYLEGRRKKLHSAFLQANRKNTDDVASYVGSIRKTFHANTRRNFLEKRDLERTVGINTFYVSDRDYKLEKGDIDMLLEQGRRATLSYLLYFVTHRYAPLKTEGPRHSFCPDDSLPYYIDDEFPSEIINENDYAEHFLVEATS